ncbi:hypothetical protein ACFWJ4_36390 [Kitasatospora sp. NPDC127067]|uniref:hypothetical protein n=1 Tax=Kitasatospora sp. NPDC127067 TaxID=3347126 RepID=UPI003655D0BF
MDERMPTKGVEARYRKGHGKAPVVITTLEGVDALVDDLLDGEDDCCTLAEVYSVPVFKPPSSISHGWESNRAQAWDSDPLRVMRLIDWRGWGAKSALCQG